MRRIVVMSAIVALTLIGVLIPAYAGGPPSLVISVPSGIIPSNTDSDAPWGEELVNDATLTIEPESEYMIEFGDFWSDNYSEESSWAGFVFEDKSPYLIALAQLNTAPEVISGVIWSGMDETRKNIPLNVYMSGDDTSNDPWGERIFTVYGCNGEVLSSTPLCVGDFFSTELPCAPMGDCYNWDCKAVPEPGSLLLFGTGIMGLAARNSFLKRRVKN